MKKVLAIVFCFLLCGCSSIQMEDFEGKTIKEVEDFAKKNNVVIEEKEIYSNVEKGRIVLQKPKKGEKLKKKETIYISTSLGRLEDEKYRENKVNELGKVPVMMYHGIHNVPSSETKYTGGNVDKDGYQRTAEAFRSDLEMYYQKGYRMISLKDYIAGNIDVPLGKSPIILTFDDGLSNNLKVTGIDEKGNIKIDPNSAVGVLEEFKKKYPDFTVTATFFVNGTLMNQKEYDEKIIKWLVQNNYDVGNHTKSHPDFTKIDAVRAETEVGSVYAQLEKIIPNKYVHIVALPFGSPYQKTHSNFSHIIKANYEGKEYETISTLRVGWESNPSPFDPSFDPFFLKRIRAYDNNGKDFDITYNFNLLEKTRYISDGNPNNIVIKKEDIEKVKNVKNLQMISYSS